MVTCSLPETVLSHGMTPLQDPFVAAVLWPFILCAWLLTLLVSAFALRHAPLLPSFLLTLGLALATMTVATPSSASRGPWRRCLWRLGHCCTAARNTGKPDADVTESSGGGCDSVLHHRDAPLGRRVRAWTCQVPVAPTRGEGHDG